MTAADRTLAVLDVENLLPESPAFAAETDYRDAVDQVIRMVGIDGRDQVAIGTGSNPDAAFGARSAWPTAAIRSRRGPDGAERALDQAFFDVDAIARGFDRVVIGSGDGYFCDLVGDLNRFGIHTLVVTWEAKLSRRLRIAAKEIRLLDDDSISEARVLRAA